MSQLPRAPGPDDVPKPRRSLGTWIILLVVWTLGLISWTLYLAGAIYVLYRLTGV